MLLGIGQRLHDLRIEKGLNIDQVAEMIGLSPKSIRNYELEYRKPKLECIVKFADLYGTTCDFILGRTDKKGVDPTTLNKKYQLYLSAIERRITSYFSSK